MPTELLQVHIGEAAPNPLFTEQQRATVRFLHYSQSVPCAECGRKRRKHWTALYEFMAHSMDGPRQFGLDRSGLVHAPLTPVCTDHLLAPAWAPDPEENNHDSSTASV